MATTNTFVIEYGLSVGSTEVINSSGKIVASALSTIDTDDITEKVQQTYITQHLDSTMHLIRDYLMQQLMENYLMSAKNFIIKNGLTIGSTEAIDSSGDLTQAFAIAANEAIDDRVNALLTAGTGISLSYDDSGSTLTITGQQGDITGIVAGTGLTGDASSGEATLNVVGGTGITANANDIEVDTSVVTTLSGTQTLTNKTLTTPIINGTVSGTV